MFPTRDTHLDPFVFQCFFASVSVVAYFAELPVGSRRLPNAASAGLSHSAKEVARILLAVIDSVQICNFSNVGPADKVAKLHLLCQY